MAYQAKNSSTDAAADSSAVAIDSFDKQDDQALIEAILAGHEQAFERLMRRYNQTLYRAARSILRDADVAEDVVQEAWWKAYTHLGDFRGQAQFSTWLTRIVINEALMQRRRNKSRAQVIESFETSSTIPQPMSQREIGPAIAASRQPDQLAWRAELRALIERHIDDLPEHYRTVFMLRAVDEMSSAEVAQILGLHEATVRVRFMRARRMMRKAMQKDIDFRSPGAFSFAGPRCDRIVAGVQARIRDKKT